MFTTTWWEDAVSSTEVELEPANKKRVFAKRQAQRKNERTLATEHILLQRKLVKTTDKIVRYEMHRETLLKYLEEDLVPMGLKIEKTAVTGNTACLHAKLN
ncbi:hypothetical protein Bbelb_363800 [Branchiostoma belcheri]|nr:hypothetical protein Bbelb_363800 [Branchiostoma belcheri]